MKIVLWHLLMGKRTGIFYLSAAVFIAISLLVRTVLLIKALPHLGAGPGLLAAIYGTGFFFDLVTFCYASIPFVFYLTLVPDRIYNHPWHRPFVQSVYFLAVSALIFNAVAEYIFFDEFGTRYNFIAVDYLVYTREVIGNIKESYPLPPIFAGIFVVAVGVYWGTRKYLRRSFSGESTLGRRLLAGAAFACIPVLSVLFVDLSLTSISKNSYANELAGNGLYDLIAAFRSSELDYNRFYATHDEQAVLSLVRDQMLEKNNHYISSDPRELTRSIANAGPEKKLNIILIVEESLSAEYLGAFGNTLGLTPNLDRLARESMLFTRLYATGTRTVRGLEAITLSMPPLPGVSIVKRPGNEGFFSWGTVMKEKGYDTRYIYAGYGYFDNMSYFFSHNDFTIVDRGSFAKDEVTFANIWGVCDEDLFKKTIREGDASWSAGKPFFSMVMTTSNHRPYTFPPGKIDIPSGKDRGGGVKYADYALGRLIDQARKRPWFKDTLFVILADHCAASAGSTELPVKRYEIPLLVYGPAHIKPRHVDTVMSQIDLAPTILGMLNFSYETKFMGRDILRMDPARARAFISTYQKLGYLQGDNLVVLGPQKYLRSYTFDPVTGKTAEVPARGAAVDTAIAYFQGANAFYTNRSNRLTVPARP